MAKTVLNVKTDKEVKGRAQKIAEELGLPLSTVVNAYLKEFIREKRVTFSTKPQLRPEVEKLLAQVKRDIKANKNLSKPFKTAKEINHYLNSRA